MKALLLCAGFGTGMRPYTNFIPKPAIPLLNVPVAYYSLHLVQQLGVGEIIVNTHHLPGRIKDLFGPQQKLGVTVEFSDEQPLILDTGGAILAARKYLNGHGTFVVANTDTARSFSLNDGLQSHLKKKPLATMIVMRHPDAGTKYGAVWVNKAGEVVDFGRKSPEGVECEPFHYTGVQFMEEEIFKYLPPGPSSILDAYRLAIKGGEKIQVFKKRGKWLDAGTLPDYLASTNALLGLLPRLQHEPMFQTLFRRFWFGFERRPQIWEGEGCEHTMSLGSKQPFLMGNFCKVGSGAQIFGFCVLGDNVIVDDGALIANSVVLSGAHIRAGSEIRNTLYCPELELGGPQDKS